MIDDRSTQDGLAEQSGDLDKGGTLPGYKGVPGWLHIFWLLIPFLLWWSLRHVPFEDILTELRRLQAFQLIFLMLVNIAIVLLFSWRWWLVIHSLRQKVGFWWVALYHSIGFALNYFTPGPQVGGEPYQVLVLIRRHGMPAPLAITSVFLDKLLELLANFTFMVLGLAVILLSNLFADWVRIWMWPLVLGILALPGAHLAPLWSGKYPLTKVIGHWAGLSERPIVRKAFSLVQEAEQEISFVCQTRPRLMVGTILLSGLTWVGLVGEYWLVVRFLGISLSLAQTMVALTLGRIAFIVPLPGGLGALEASQVLAMQVLGFSPALGLSISLVIRARDILNGLVGFGMGGWLSRQSIRSIS